jgi:hypothetical protein
MAYEKPTSTANQIDKAGKVFFNQKLSVDERAEAVRQIWDWRTAHSYPLNALHMTLRGRALKVDVNALSAQRLKRLPSILRKLGRQPTMQMSQMQDIGGCRAIVTNMSRLRLLRFIYETNPLRHALSRTRDYIEDPKEDGYRSVHMMYRFSGKASSLPWHNLRIEVQMRTKLQHSWATSVETVDAFVGEDLKFGKGTSDWRRFFQLMGTVHARSEKAPDVPHTPANESRLFKEVKELERKLEVIRNLRAYARVTSHITRQQRGVRRDWYIVEMFPDEQRVTVRGFSLEQFAQAKQTLAELENKYQSTKNQVALVSTSSLTELRKAYPNYFADTAHFTGTLERFLK